MYIHINIIATVTYVTHTNKTSSLHIFYEVATLNDKSMVGLNFGKFSESMLIHKNLFA